MANLTQKQLDAILRRWDAGWHEQETEGGRSRWNEYEGDIGVTTPVYNATHTGGDAGNETASENPSGFQRIVGYDGKDPILDTWDAEGNYIGRGRSSGSFIGDLTDAAMPLLAMYFMPQLAGAVAGGGAAGAAAAGQMGAGMRTVMGLGAMDTAGDTGNIAGMIGGALGAASGIAGLSGATDAASTLRDLRQAASVAGMVAGGGSSSTDDAAQAASQALGISPQYGGTADSTTDFIAHTTPVDMTPKFLKQYEREQEDSDKDFNEDDFKQLLKFVGVD